MKVKFFLVLLCFVSVQALGQSVSIEPGKSVFDNASIGTEINVNPSRPLKISAEDHLAPIDFYNYSRLDGRLRTSYKSMQIFGRSGVLLFPSIDSTIGPKFNLYPDGKLTIADNAYLGLYRLTVMENDENVAFFGNTTINGNATINLNNQAYLTSSTNNLKIAGNAAIAIESNTTGSLLFKSNNTNRFLINGTNGNVGIGTNSPLFPFHMEVGNDTVAKFKNKLNNFSRIIVHDQMNIGGGKISDNGVLKDYGSINSSGLLFVQSSAQQNYHVNGNYAMRIDKNGDVTVNPLYSGTDYLAAKANLDVGGTVRSSVLDFTETNFTERRPVFADKDGILRTSSFTNQYMSYNFSSIHSQDWDNQLRKGSGYAWFNTTTSGGTMYLPVNLPDGVKVTNVRMYFLDNSVSDISFVFNRNTHTNNSFTSIAAATSSSTNAGIRNITSTANETIDNSNNSYYVNISSVGNWTGNTLQFHSLVITYNFQ